MMMKKDEKKGTEMRGRSKEEKGRGQKLLGALHCKKLSFLICQCSVIESFKTFLRQMLV